MDKRIFSITKILLFCSLITTLAGCAKVDNYTLPPFELTEESESGEDTPRV